jgi:hypothetical protein
VAIAAMMNFAGGSNAAYDRVLEKMGLTDGITPPHAIYHVAGEVEGGFRVVDVWESEEAFQRFAQEQIGPISAEEGFPPPSVEIWQVHNTMQAG